MNITKSTLYLLGALLVTPLIFCSFVVRYDHVK